MNKISAYNRNDQTVKVEVMFPTTDGMSGSLPMLHLSWSKQTLTIEREEFEKLITMYYKELDMVVNDE